MKVWVVEVLYEGDAHSTRTRICGSYEKAKGYIEYQYDCACEHMDKEYDTITEMKIIHRDTCDQFVWYENDEITTYFITCEAVM